MVAACILGKPFYSEDYEVVAVNHEVMNVVTEAAAASIRLPSISEEYLRSCLTHYPLAKKSDDLGSMLKRLQVFSRVTVELNTAKHVNQLIVRIRWSLAN